MVKNLPPIQKMHVQSLSQGKILWRRKWQPTPAFLPGESHGQRSLAGYTVHKITESDTTGQISHQPLLTSRTCEQGGPKYILSFPDSSAGKEPACNARDPGSIPRSESSRGEGTGYPLQYSWTSLVVQPVKNPPAMWETWVRSLGREDPLVKGMATQSSILARRIPWTV